MIIIRLSNYMTENFESTGKWTFTFKKKKYNTTVPVACAFDLLNTEVSPSPFRSAFESLWSYFLYQKRARPNEVHCLLQVLKAAPVWSLLTRTKSTISSRFSRQLQSEARSPERSPLSYPGLGGSFAASPSALPPAAMSDIRQRCGLGTVEECVQGSGVLSDRDTHPCRKSGGSGDQNSWDGEQYLTLRGVHQNDSARGGQQHGPFFSLLFFCFINSRGQSHWTVSMHNNIEDTDQSEWGET